MTATSRPWVIIGNPENRRVALFQRALSRRHLPPAEVRSYEGLLSGRESLKDLPQGAMVRFESPGENFAVERLLLAAGAADAEQEVSPVISAEAAGRLNEDTGRVLHPRQVYLGYLASCRKWFTALAAQPTLTLTTGYEDLRLQFDKTLCHAHFAEQGIPVPESLGSIQGWDDLVDRMQQHAAQRVFVKIANGSSASGVVALQVRRDKVQAITSVEMVADSGELRLYNSLKIRCYTRLEDVRMLVDELARHQVHVERWLPKASIDRRVFDLRIVVIAGRPRHMVVRTSRTPLTNLHLGNRRGDTERVLQQIPDPQRLQLDATCARCSQALNHSLHIGLDVLFTPGYRQHFVLESNAFGDLLPGVLHEGCDTYQAEIDGAAKWQEEIPRDA